MGTVYLGHVLPADPLFHYLRHEIQPQLGGNGGDVDYRVFKFTASNDVYLYEERLSGTRCIGKFFLSQNQPDRALAARRCERECHHLAYMRQFGFDRSPHYIARPLGRNSALNELLIVEFCHGELLSSVIRRAIRNRDDTLLFHKLTALAYFLSQFHNRTACADAVDIDEACRYGDSLVQRLQQSGVIRSAEADDFRQRSWSWRDFPPMREDRQVIVHGDATPENFMFGDDLHVITFDLERLRRADRMHDIGRMAGELAHFHMAETGDRIQAEPFIGHFLWEYACHFPDREATFQAIARRVPFYMGLTLLRIARNDWLAAEYRRRLIDAARQCLQARPA